MGPLPREAVHANGTDTHPSPGLADGWRALNDGAWEDARRHFSAAIAQGETPEALEGLGMASWWLADVPRLFASRERACHLYRERGDHRAAGRLATEIGYDYAIFRLELAVASGWLQRAHSMLDGAEPAPEQVWLALREGELTFHLDGDPDRMLRLARHAKAIASQLGLTDLEMLGQASEGLGLVSIGEVPAGMRLLDEAAVAAVSGEMRDFRVITAILCVMVWACDRVQDLERASQWCEQFSAYCQRHRLRTYLGYCRSHYGSFLTVRGQWREAEDMLTQASDAIRERIAWSLPLLERLGELRRRQGRLDEAAACFEQARLYPQSTLGMARVALDRGDPRTAHELASAMLRRLPANDRMQRTGPLELVVRSCCAQGEPEEAGSALAQLEAIGAAIGSDSQTALVHHLRGQVALAASDPSRARDALEDALESYERSRMPYEAAMVRIDLGHALRALDRPEAALGQLRAARDSLMMLGAHAQAARVPAEDDERRAIVSAREAEVLRLLAQGLSNREIADRLFISMHTVRRHVSSILTKLDVPSRTAAAAWAHDHDLT